MRFTTTAPTSGLAASVGESVLYVTGGAATLYYKYGATDTEWCTTPAGGGAKPVTTDPRGDGLAATVGSVVLYVPFAGSPALLYKYGSGNTDWCTWDAAVAAHVHAMADVTGLVAALAAKAPLASPTFTGTPAAPTAAPGTNTTQLATTAFVAAAVGGGGVSDGDKGDITVSGGGTAWTIDNAVVTDAKVAAANKDGLVGTASMRTLGTGAQQAAAGDHAHAGVYQPADAGLTSIAALPTVADRIAYSTAADTWAETAITAFGRSLIDDADAATALATLGAQPLDADLTALAASAATAGLVERTGAATYTTRLIGVANATDIPTRGDGDTRYAAASHGHSRVVGATFDGSGSPPTAGTVGYAVVPFNGTIDQWHVVANASGSAVIDVWKAAGAIPTDANRIAGTEKPTLVAAQLGSDTNLTTWTTLAVTAGDVFGFELESATSLTRVTVEIRITDSP